MSEKQHLDSDLRVVEIGVRGLFGLYDHTIKLNSAERITIIHGPNGVGKTKVLEMVNHFLSFNFEILYDQYREIFKELYVILKCDTKLSILSENIKDDFTLKLVTGEASWEINKRLLFQLHGFSNERKFDKSWRMLILKSLATNNLISSIALIGVERLYQRNSGEVIKYLTINACTAHLLSLLDES